MPDQAASSASARVRREAGFDRRNTLDQLRGVLTAGRNADGGWGYYPGKTSRLEPTCWALLALGTEAASRAAVDPASAWLAQCQRPAGWLIENPEWPANVAFNALAAFTLLQRRELFSDDGRHRLLTSVIASKGAPGATDAAMRQDNSLQGWPWIDGTFSWVEPTCWGLLALKKWGQTGVKSLSDPSLTPAAAAARIAEAERMLVDRSCQPGGWNFGNAMVMRQDLRPYVPTTALGLLALQDRRDEAVVARGLAELEEHWDDEISAVALGLSVVCLTVYTRPVDQIVSRLVQHIPKALTFGNLHGLAVSLFALSSLGQPHAFKF